ncbi:MAG TPA: hypothetical protein VFQ91_13545 [Bryobacteraceae bacterium]|nr:hypothetical protein [Bryobacteraceae bacterium]
MDDWFSQAFRSFFGAIGANTVQPPVPRIHLRLRFLDPLGVVRDFPPNFPVRVRFGSGGGAVTVVPSPPIGNRGILSFDARTTAPWQNFTLEFPAGEIPYIVCEPLGSPPASPPRFQPASGLTAASGQGQRFFSLPQNWELRQADWSPPTFTGNGRFDAPNGTLVHTLSPPANISMGTPANPVVLILNPHWHFLRFEYYDRYFGNAHLDSPPRAAHRARISLPPIAVDGFRADPNAAGSPPTAHSNWAIDLGNKSLLQAIPFVERRTAAGVTISPPSGAQLGLRFQTPANTVVYAQTDTRRVMAVSPPPSGAGPQPDRLRYYDVPPIWKSRKYYTRRVVSSPPAPGKFFDALTAAEIAQAERRANPLVFCLDDMVLYTATPALAALPALGAQDRVAVFGHRFANDLPNCGTQGLYKSMPSGTAGMPLELPFSNVPTASNYIWDYPDWTRLVVAQGNLFDVFDRRTPDGAAATQVVGARAAVRWVDSGAPPGIPVGSGAGAVLPGASLTPGTSRSPGPAANSNIGLGGAFPAQFNSSPPFFAMRPFYGQFRPDSRFQPFNPARRLLRGRFDIALLRCTDVEAGNEVAVNLHYIKKFFNFVSPPASPPQFAHDMLQRVSDRWSGNETAVVANPNQVRTLLLPQLSPPGLRAPKTMVVWYCQSVPNNRAHCAVRVIPIGRANRETIFGGGDSGPNDHVIAASGSFASAHESGHMDGLPDEYSERWRAANATYPNGPVTYGEMGLSQNLPGDPYEFDDRTFGGPPGSMMNTNQHPRNRHFWHAAEWVRGIYGTPLRVQVNPTFNNYTLPRFAVAGQTDSAYYPWPLVGMTNQSNPASPPSQFDLYLHVMGTDVYSAQALPGSSLASPFDGVLVIVVRIYCTLPATAVTATETANRTAILNGIASAVQNQLNNRFSAAGTANYGAPATTHVFRRCLLEFRASVVVVNHPFNAAAQGSSNQVTGAFPRHFSLVITSPPSSPPASPMNLGTRTLTIHTPVVPGNPVPAFMANYSRMLGIASPPPPPPPGFVAGTSLDAADLLPIVRLVMPGAGTTVTRFR